MHIFIYNGYIKHRYLVNILVKIIIIIIINHLMNKDKNKMYVLFNYNY